MSVNRSGYYNWLNRGKNQYELNREILASYVRNEHGKHPSYGYHALAKVIRDNTGCIFSDNPSFQFKYRIKSRLKGLTPMEYRNQALINY